MTKSKQRQKVGGAVLVMVLIVMVVLIIMLMATLTVVTTAGQRIYTKYEENQAYYSARSALDIFTQNMLEDDGYYAYNSSGGIRLYSYTDSDGNTQTANMKQGLALQLEVYKIKSQGIKTQEVAQSLHSSMTDEAARAAMDYAENMDPGEIFATGSPEDDNFSVGKTGSTYVDSITYQVTLPTLTDPKASGTQQKNYGELVDTDDSTGEQIATIKVEVLDRLYDTNGAFSGDDNYIREQIIDVIENGTTDEQDALKENIKNGNRSKDKITLKVTSTVQYLDHEASAVLIYDAAPKPPTLASKAIISLGTATNGDSFIPVGGTSTLNGDLSTTNSSLFVGDAYISHNLSMAAGARMYFYEDTVHTILGNMSYENTVNNYYYGAGSTMYIGGTLSLSSSAANYGTATYPTNLIANRIEASDIGAFNGASFYGNVYANEFDISKGVWSNTEANIYTNFVTIDSSLVTIDTANDIITFDSDYGRLCSNVNISSKIVNIRDAATNTVTEYTFDRANAMLIRTSDSKSYSTNFDASTDTLTVNMTYTNPSFYENKLTSDYKKKFTMPVTLAGQTDAEVEIPTARTVYNQILENDESDPSTFAFIKEEDSPGHGGDVKNSVTEYPQPTVAPDYTQTSITIEHDGWTETKNWAITGDVTDSTYIAALIAGMDEETRVFYYGEAARWYSSDYENDRSMALAIYNAALTDATQNDPDYQNQLATYWSAYINGAEKAQVSDSTLYVYTNYVSTKTKDDTTAIPDDVWSSAATTTYIDESGCLQPNTNYGTVIIDASQHAIDIQLGSATDTGSSLSFFGKFIVYGDKGVRVFLPSTTTNDKEYNFGNTGNSFQLWSYDIYELYTTNTPLELGIEARTGKTLTPSPSIHIYAADKVKKISMYRDGIITGHIYAPLAEFFNEMPYTTFDTYFNGALVENEVGNVGNYAVIGSIICGGYSSSSSKPAVAYIGDEVTQIKQGDPILTWSPYKYTRN